MKNEGVEVFLMDFANLVRRCKSITEAEHYLIKDVLASPELYEGDANDPLPDQNIDFKGRWRLRIVVQHNSKVIF